MEKPTIKPTASVDRGERWQLVTWDGEKRQRDQRDQRGQSDQAAEGSPVCDLRTISLINQAQEWGLYMLLMASLNDSTSFIKTELPLWLEQG